MTSKRTIRQVAVTLFLLAAFLLQGTWALAGTTGGLGGYVTDDQGKAVAGASVKVVSASQAASGTTDASGHFTFLALAPDTYTVSIVKDGFAPFSEAGITVFADQQQALSFQLQRQLKTIANVTSTAAGSLVKTGVGSDIYNVNSAAIQAASALGGGGNLNSAYSAMSSVPGVNVPIGGMGWNNNVAYIRGSQSFFTGYEYDGVPVNRAFDNYNSSTESNLGLQELQVYTGGGPASNSSSGTSGFINQVIKTGTYPGYATATGGIASSAFYHQAEIEAGGASPDRNFSYYAGFSGYNQAFRLLNNSNAVGFMGPGGIYSDYSPVNADLPVATGSGAYPMCNLATGDTPLSVQKKTGFTDFCLTPYTGLSAFTNLISDRENVVNFHFGIPRKDGQRDDVQLLWTGSMLKTQYYSSVDDLGGPNAFMLAEDGVPYSAPTSMTGTGLTSAGSCLVGGPNNCPGYVDGYVFNSPFGTPASNLSPSFYYEPNSPTDRAQFGELPFNSEDSIYNDQGIVKLQYTHSMGSNAYARVFAYTFYSDWMLAGPTTSLNYIFDAPVGCCANNYELSTHTAGGEFQLSDQINDKNLLQFTANYTTANVLRDNNETNIYGYLGIASPAGYVSEKNGQYSCYDDAAGDAVAAGYTLNTNGTLPCYALEYGQPLSATSPYPLYNATGVAVGATAPGESALAAANGATLQSLWAGPEFASYNTVQPKFSNISLSDQFRPNDRWLINAAVRYENYDYGMPDSITPADNFYAQIAANNFCYNTTPGQQGVYSAPLLPGQFPPAEPITIPQSTDCNAYISGLTGTTVTGYVHPNGTTQDGVVAPNFTAASPNSYTLNYWSARYSATYTESPDTVWRFSGGRFIEPPISASIQYLNNSGNNLGQWANFMDLGFFSPFHNIPSQTSGQYDLSLERHIRGTDMSYKITPFYNLTNGYQEQSFIGPGYVTQVPVGRFQSLGVEGAFTKGDFSRNGLSGTLAVTYTHAAVQFQSGLVNNLGANQISYYNAAIQNYNALAKGGSDNFPCFTFADAATSSAGTGIGTVGVAQACTAGEVTNPYFSSPKQGLLNLNGWYAPASDVALPGVNNNDLGLYDVPWIGSLILNWRHDKFAVTPSIQISSGSSYGSPFTVQGVDPRLCTANDLSPDAPAGQCAYTSLIGQGDTGTGDLFIPNPQTGYFDSLGAYRNPAIMVANIGFSYDLTPRITVNLVVANFFHDCFGGSKEAWTSAYPAGTNVCGYAPNGVYVSNYQLGPGFSTPGVTSSYSAADNGTSLYPWQQQSYAPTIGSAAGDIPPPFNAYLTFNIKL